MLYDQVIASLCTWASIASIRYLRGLPGPEHAAEQDKADNTITKRLFTDTSVEGVKNHIAPLNGNVKFYPGFFPHTIPEGFDNARFSFVHLDADLYEPVLDWLKYFYDRVIPGGYMLVNDYNAWIGERKVVIEFFKSKMEIPIPMPDKSGSALIQKQ